MHPRGVQLCAECGEFPAQGFDFPCVVAEAEGVSGVRCVVWVVCGVWWGMGSVWCLVWCVVGNG
jgi:hypothetical protein